MLILLPFTAVPVSNMASLCRGYFMAVPLTRRDMGWEQLTETVTRMDAGAEPPWKGLRRVSVRCYRFMSRSHRETPNPAT